MSHKGGGLEKLVMASTRDVRLTQVRGEVVRLPGNKMIQKRGPVDFMGVYVPSRRPLVFDAKVCGKQHRLETSRSTLPPHQREQIIAYGRAGAVAGILAESTFHRVLYWLRWDALVDDAPSYPWQHPLMFDVGDSFHAVDWRGLVEAHDSYEISGIIVSSPNTI